MRKLKMTLVVEVDDIACDWDDPEEVKFFMDNTLDPVEGLILHSCLWGDEVGRVVAVIDKELGL